MRNIFFLFTAIYIFAPRLLAQTRHALIIGIDQYQPAGGKAAIQPGSGRSGFSNLDGCKNDAEAMKTLLISRFGFTPGSIREVYNQAATRTRIMDEMRNIAEKAGKDDVVFIFYAGHGSQQPNSLSPENDKMDETIVPADAWQSEISDIRDKEQRVMYNAILSKGAKLTVILDCCHSGSMSRGGEPVYSRPKFRKIDKSNLDAKDPGTAPLPETVGGDRFLLISAAQDYELAAEAVDDDGVPHGAFSLAMMKAMGQSTASVSTGNLFAAVRNILKSNGVAQEPQIVCTDKRLNENLLGLAPGTMTNKTVVSLRTRPGGEALEISAGSGLGLRKGNEFCVVGDTATVVKVDAVLGVAAATVKWVRGDKVKLKPGQFLELTNWVSEEKPLLSIYVPSNPFQYSDVQKLSIQFNALRAKNPAKWVDNLNKVTPELSVWYFNGILEMQLNGELVSNIGWKDLEAAIQKPGVKHAIFYLPVPAELKTGIGKYFLPGTSYQITANPMEAQYHVTGSVNADGTPAYYLMNKASSAKDSLEALPNETDRQNLKSPAVEAVDGVSYKLFEYAVRIGRVRGWLQVGGPSNNDFPYQLAVVRKDGSIAGPEGLKYKENATLKLIPSDGFDPQTTFVKPKYIYAFAIERTGRMILLYPERGSGDRFPSKLTEGGVEKGKTLGNFDIEEPVGTDNFFVLAVTEPISNPQAIFNQDGVYTSRNASLKGLLDPLINMGTRSVKLGRTETGNNWNLLRLGLRSSH